MLNLKAELPRQEIYEIAAYFDAVLGGDKVLPEKKGLHVAAVSHGPSNTTYIEISFPRLGGRFGDVWEEYLLGKIDSKKACQFQQYLTSEMTSEEKDRSVSLAHLLKEENLISHVGGIECFIYNDEIEGMWFIDHGPRVTLRIPRAHINEDVLREKAEQRHRLEEAEGLILQLAKAKGIKEENIKGYGVEGITFDHPIYIAGLSCELCHESDKGIKALTDALKEIGFALEALYHDAWGENKGNFILRLENPYDKEIVRKLKTLLLQNCATAQFS